MSWQWADEPSHIAPETGPNLLTGSGPWTVALTPGAEYALTVDVLGEGDTLVEWQVSVTDGETGDLDYPSISETVPGGDWVTVTLPLTAPAFDATANITLATPGQSRAPSLAALTGRTVLTVPGDVLAETIMASGGIVAGTPGGARVELTDEGLAAFDTDGTETAQIRGAGGEFVGGEFRTSDESPGQVTLSDTAFRGGPGIEVEPVDPSGFTTSPGLGPSSNGLLMSGGRGGTGSTAAVAAHHDYVSVYHNGPGSTGSGAWVEANGTEAKLTYRSDRSERSATSQIRVTEGQSLVTSTDGDSTSYFASFPDHVNIEARQGERSGSVAAGLESVQLFFQSGDSDQGAIFVDGQRTYLSQIKDGVARYLTVDDSGIWVQTIASGQTKSYNLEETAQDSGWIPITPATGYQNASGGAPFEYRLMGGMIHLRGRISPTSGAFSAGTAYTIGTLPASIRPTHTHRTIIAGGSSSQWGRVDISAGTGSLTVAPISGGMDWVDLTGTAWTVD